ncbi:MAG: nickel pincer cofactor biosynthesis protein LarB [Candidatus Omnitrophica bacterium]|nr:nickel pincer cofactor biosynthesis protein LarB [Candidatus Omnitrophota bacterium]MCM8799311.1 nickel pincer cofactor biosynthesis protein LarB [Candidatus Omnitrophota bacterium]
MQKEFVELGFAKLDLDRFRRRGFAEVIFCKGKTKQQLLKIIKELIKHKQPILLTKLERKEFRYLKRYFPSLKYNPLAKIAYAKKLEVKANSYVCVITAGTADIPIAEEAITTLEVMGNKVKKIYDIGVAGLHRLYTNLDTIRKAKVIVVVAGMEAALPSLVSGLVAKPVIAVPTSFGYGANFFGLSALLTMLNSCSPGIGVVNIDNGFGAGYLASLINKG